MPEGVEEIALHEVDDALSLAFCLSRSGPLVTILNRVTGKRKNVSLAWFLKGSREMHIRTRPGATVTYTVQTIDEALYTLVSRATKHPLVKPLIWGTFRALTEILHQPKLVARESDFAMLPEEKRFGLWIAWLPSAALGGVLIPCFPFQETEREALTRKAGRPEDIRIQAGEATGTVLVGKGIPTALMGAAPQRWYLPVMVEAVAAVLGMIETDGEGTHPLTPNLWRIFRGIPQGKPLSRAEILLSVGDEIRRLALHIRHFHTLPLVEQEERIDGQDILAAEGFHRRHRVEEPMGSLGRWSYRITTFGQKDGPLGAIVYHPMAEMLLPDTILRFPAETLIQARQDDACGSTPDAHFTLLALFRAVRRQAWMDRVLRIARQDIPSP